MSTETAAFRNAWNFIQKLKWIGQLMHLSGVFTSFGGFPSNVIGTVVRSTMISTTMRSSFSRNGSTTVISTPNVMSWSIFRMSSVVFNCGEISSISVMMGSTRNRFRTNCLFGMAITVLFSVSTHSRMTAENDGIRFKYFIGKLTDWLHAEISFTWIIRWFQNNFVNVRQHSYHFHVILVQFARI